MMLPSPTMPITPISTPTSPIPLLNPLHNLRNLRINDLLTPRIHHPILRHKITRMEPTRDDVDRDLLGRLQGPAGALVRGDGDVAPGVVAAIGENETGGVGGGPAAGDGVLVTILS